MPEAMRSFEYNGYLYTFIGWTTDEEASMNVDWTGTKFCQGSEYDNDYDWIMAHLFDFNSGVYEDLILYAVWSATPIGGATPNYEEEVAGGIVPGGDEPTPPDEEPPVENIEEHETPLEQFFSLFEPRDNTNTKCWALLNLICVVLTVYTFLPLHGLRSKFRRRKTIKDLYEAYPDVYDLKGFTRSFRVGLIMEFLISVLAVVAFILTEDLKTPMVLIDKWTLLMVLIFFVCWLVDVRFLRYRGDKHDNSGTNPGASSPTAAVG